MNLSHQSNQPHTAQIPYPKLYSALFAVCIVLAPLALSLWFGVCPTGANDAGCPFSPSASATAVAFRTAPPLLLQLFFVLTVVSAYVYPLSYIGLGRLAMGRSPWLASIGITCGFIGSVVWSLFAGETFWVNSLTQLGFGTQFPKLRTAYLANWGVVVMHSGWVIGHLLGYLLVGMALLRARVIPQWATWLIMVSALVMGPLAYGTGLGLLQILGYLLVSIGSIPAALAPLKIEMNQRQ